MSLSDKINAAFESRQRPNDVADISRPAITDRQDAECLSCRAREELDWSLLQDHADALYAMTPLAFRYYLPQFMVLAMDRRDVTPLFVSPILQMLDAGPDETYWSERFKQFWVGMTAHEYEAIKAWLIFMASSDDTGQDQIVLARAFDTIDLLSHGASA